MDDSRALYYRLKGSRAVPCSWVEAQPILADYRGRCLAYEQTSNGYQVSTSFLVFDHNLLGDRPILWNTIVSDPQGHQRILGRYSTEREARLGHRQIVSFISLIGEQGEGGSDGQT